MLNLKYSNNIERDQKWIHIITFNVFGHVVVDDVCDALDVYSAASDVRRNEDIVFARPEALHRLLSLLLTLATVQHDRLKLF